MKNISIMNTLLLETRYTIVVTHSPFQRQTFRMKIFMATITSYAIIRIQLQTRIAGT